MNLRELHLTLWAWKAWLVVTSLLLGGCSMQVPALTTRVVETKAGERILVVPIGSKLVVRSTAHGVLHLDAGTVEIEALPASPIPPPQPAPNPPGPAPNPPTPPAPGPVPPNPTPPLPDGKYGLARWTVDTVGKLLADRPTRAAEAKLVAVEIEAVASKLVAGGYPSGTAAMSDIYDRTERALGDAGGAWEPVRAAIEEKLRATFAARLGAGLSDVGEALLEVSAGMSVVK